MRRSRPNQTEARTRTRTFFVLLGLVFLPFALLAVTGYLLLARGPVSAAEQRLRSEAQSLADEIDRDVADLLDLDRDSSLPSHVLQYYTRRSNRWYRGRSPRSIERYHRSNAGVYRRRLLQSQPSIELKRLRAAGLLPDAELVLTDSVGRVLAATSNPEQVLCGDKQWWLQAYRGGQGGTYLELVRTDEACSVTVAKPVYDSTGDTLRGILRMTRHLPQLAQRIRSVTVGATGFALLVSGSGEELAAHGQHAWLSDESRQHIATAETSRYWGQGRDALDNSLVAAAPVMSTTPAGQQRWIVAVAQSVSEFAPRRDALAYGLAALLLVVGAAVAVVAPVITPRKRRPARDELVQPVVDQASQLPEPEPEPAQEPAQLEEPAPLQEPAPVQEPPPQEPEPPVPAEPASEPEKEQAAALETAPEPEQDGRPTVEPAPVLEAQPAEIATEEDAIETRDAPAGAVDEEAESFKTDLIATIARELRAPLPPIVDLATLMMKSEISEDSRRKFLAIIAEEGSRLMQLIDKFSTLSLLESGRHELRLEEVDIRRTVGRVLEVEARHQPRHQLRNEIPDDLPAVRADPQRIGTAIQVLVSNAVLYSPAGGPVTVTGREEDGFVAISVRDQGVGIRNQDLPMLFSRFQRLNREATPNVRGFGLGLSICKGIVEQHGGRIKVDSVYGEGSTFTLLLPVLGPAENRQVPLDI